MGVGVRWVCLCICVCVCVGEVILITTNFTKGVTETKPKARACIDMERNECCHSHTAVLCRGEQYRRSHCARGYGLRVWGPAGHL